MGWVGWGKGRERKGRDYLLTTNYANLAGAALLCFALLALLAFDLPGAGVWWWDGKKGFFLVGGEGEGEGSEAGGALGVFSFFLCVCGGVEKSTEICGMWWHLSQWVVTRLRGGGEGC